MKQLEDIALRRPESVIGQDDNRIVFTDGPLLSMDNCGAWTRSEYDLASHSVTQGKISN